MAVFFGCPLHCVVLLASPHAVVFFFLIVSLTRSKRGEYWQQWVRSFRLSPRNAIRLLKWLQQRGRSASGKPVTTPSVHSRMRNRRIPGMIIRFVLTEKPKEERIGRESLMIGKRGARVMAVLKKMAVQ